MQHYKEKEEEYEKDTKVVYKVGAAAKLCTSTRL
jgi:hypothetical protein